MRGCDTGVTGKGVADGDNGSEREGMGGRWNKWADDER